jgi:chromosome segregation protein
VFLTSLSLRGFKSFADKTTLDVEPGITVIVGPNGSGKSNVVDALAWVLGTASPKKVRGGSMSDVIFAGSPTRSAHGSARVEITIDNSEGCSARTRSGPSGSAQQFTEVRVAREIFASGESSYLINGEEVRALDVQELLSDTGLGRELHTIVGQGQLDEILNAKPEERRRYIEEAAGILKHRRRRERALRKLEHVDDHIDKLKAVLRELRRQLRPLERQAEAADKYQALQAELRDVQVRLAAHDLAVLVERRERQGRADADAAQRERSRRRRRRRAQGCDAAPSRASARRSSDPRVDAAQRTYYELTSLNERLRGTADLIAAKRRHLVEYVEEPLAGRPPEELRAAAERADRERQQRQATATAPGRRSRRRSGRAGRPSSPDASTTRSGRRRPAVAPRPASACCAGRARCRPCAVRSPPTEAEAGRVASQLTSLDDRVAEAEAEVAKVQNEIQQLDTREVDLTAELEAAESAVAAAQARVDAMAAEERDLERDRSSFAARAEALRAALTERAGGTAALLDADAASGLDGLLGPVADHVRVDETAGAAVARRSAPSVRPSSSPRPIRPDVRSRGCGARRPAARPCSRLAPTPRRRRRSTTRPGTSWRRGARPRSGTTSTRPATSPRRRAW